MSQFSHQVAKVPVNSTPTYIPSKLKTGTQNTCTWMSATVQSTNVQTTKTSVKHQMDTQNVVLLLKRNQVPLGLTDTHCYI